jgi:uncharacterized protein YndB with AHSA1/START domain
MAQTRVKRTINAPIDKVFATVATIDEFSKAIPQITHVEVLSETRTGVGTRFKETRNMNGREGTVELEVTEYVDNERIRLVSEAGGATWDTVFSVRQSGGATELEMVMVAKPGSLVSRLVIPLTKGLIKRAIERDMDAVKSYCEST